MSQRLLTTEDAAVQLGVTPARVRQMIIAGRLPAQRFGRSHMILESDLHLVEHRVPGRPPKIKTGTKPTKQRGRKAA
jgi:excisionase family DNA binding protein